MPDADQHHKALVQLQAIHKDTGAVCPGRLYSPEAYLACLMPHLAVFGITRLADITGLDRIGIPVVQAVRPMALSNAVNQGKGLTCAEAAVSSVMEALETCCSEHPPNEEMNTSRAESIYGAVAAKVLAHHLQPGISEDWVAKPMPFVRGVDLLTGHSVSVPSALVSTDYTPTSVHATTPFKRTTTGLGAGATQEEALIHALYETLERQGTERAMKIHGFFEKHRIDPKVASDPSTMQVFEILDKADFLHAVYECPSSGNCPVIWVRLLDGKDSITSLPFHADGFACRTNLADAIRAALLEAIQTRAAVIAGGREDITWRFYPKRWDTDLVAFERRQMRDTICNTPSVLHPPAVESVQGLAKVLAAGEMRSIAVPVIASMDPPLHVLRVVTLAKAGAPDQ